MNILVEEFTSPATITINLNAGLSEAYKLMLSNGIRHLPVIEDGKVVGIISERDIVANIGREWSDLLRVKSVMCTSMLSAYVNENLGDVAYRLSKEKKGSAIVLDAADNLYGMFTTTDALNALVEILCPDAKAKSMLE